ncbi:MULTISPECIES: PhoH family protein [Faecalicoccus]|uniref:PhoH-like protein n=1 Tax=Faecalicoccus pleomorphus TaxID=1323 RepID=A0AAW6CP08_9FIRM|nr:MULTISPECIES: PhoH family protein [Faecalicoccus]MDB7978999.1 PhoH family protein [Faecalicoccus pleomorphus]MDB7981278.1 PhoH family protein [Faecalicoccus pleomorphus]MDB7987900.1 PhoH family protein [Faecalicoccus pleomorphus]MDB7992559.1 PhoH family protein [Faecalicoccus pleomorphus]MDY4278363.1 PhoH family protein [Faecalicoccus sp.]
MAFKTIDLSNYDVNAIQIFVGNQDVHLQVLRKAFKTDFILRDQQLKFDSEQFDEIQQVVSTCFDLIESKHKLNEQDVNYLCRLAKNHQLDQFDLSHLQPIAKTKSGKLIYPKTLGQAILCDAFFHNDIIFASGVAGTGKTYLAVCYAVMQLKKEEVEKIILTRPAVEAGESLGFLPGDMKDKVDPYLRPLYDALYDMLGVETVERFMEKQVIEVAPLAFMRGRTLNKAVVILDEAQNTTQAQMKMFLTRMGQNAQMIINGDVTQIDLIRKEQSGLVQATQILKGIDRIAFVQMSADDVVRHPLVQKIIERYETIEN